MSWTYIVFIHCNKVYESLPTYRLVVLPALTTSAMYEQLGAFCYIIPSPLWMNALQGAEMNQRTRTI